jgi:MFS-type transporter involved in bile tolerance (Atg22 family)
MEDILDFRYVIIRWDQVLFWIQTLWLIVFITWCGTTSMILGSDQEGRGSRLRFQLHAFSIQGIILLIILWWIVPDNIQMGWQYIILFAQTALTVLVCYVCVTDPY